MSYMNQDRAVAIIDRHRRYTIRLKPQGIAFFFKMDREEVRRLLMDEDLPRGKQLEYDVMVVKEDRTIYIRGYRNPK